jgi:hypothetical protein
LYLALALLLGFLDIFRFTYRGISRMAARKKRSGRIVSAGPRRAESFAAGVGRGLRLAAKEARKTARMYGTSIYILENGKTVAKRP